MATFRFEGQFDIDAIERILDQAARQMVGFERFDGIPVRTHEFTVATLPERRSFRGLEMEDSFVSGRLPQSQVSPRELQKVLERAHHALGGYGVFGLNAAFEEKASQQEELTADSVGIWLRNGRWFLEMIGSQSQIATNSLYRKQAIAELIQAAELPLKMREKGKKFYLDHGSGGELTFFLAEGPASANPPGFSCEMPDANEATLVDQLQKALRQLAKRVFFHEWHGGPDRAQEAPVVTYDAVREARFPAATGYKLELAYHLIRVQGLDSLRQLCSDDDQVINLIASFQTEEKGKRADLEAVTSATGHELRFQLSKKDESTAATIAKRLGLRLAS